jgi:hypothetical protein
MIARGQRRRVPPAFAPAGPSARRIGPALAAASEPGPRHSARGPPGETPRPRLRGIASQGAPTIPSPDMLPGQRSDPVSPAVNQAPHLNQQTKETW